MTNYDACYSFNTENITNSKYPKSIILASETNRIRTVLYKS